MASINYRHIPYEVEAMRILKDNIADVIAWLGDDFAELHNQISFTIGDRTITVPACNIEFGHKSLVVTYRSPTDASQILYTVVFNGDWLVREKGHVYAVYTDGEFHQLFESAEAETQMLFMDDANKFTEGKDCNIEDVPDEVPAEPVEEKEEIGSMDINDLLGMVEGSDVSPADGEEDV